MGGDDEEKRARVKAEILATEKSYVSDIQTVIDVFMKPMLASANDPATAVASRDEVVTLFSNLESILFFNQQLLVSLEDEAANGQSSIGQIFIEMAPYLRMYCIYVNNHSRAAELHQELLSRSLRKDGVSKYQAFLQECGERSVERTKNRQLTDLLIMPVQRVPRYRLLLEELLKRTPPGDEYETLEMALAKIADAANLVNERLREFENRMMVLKVQGRLGNSVSLVQPHRMYVTEAVLQKVCRKGPRDYVFVLFSDLLVYGSGSNMSASEYDGEQAIGFKRQIDLATASLATVNNVSLKITSPTKSFVVIAPDPTTREAWFNALQACISSCVSRAAEIAAEPVAAPASLVVEDGHAPVWVPDKEAPVCQLPECGVRFTLLTRRHHCRMCGLVVCAECSPHRWLLPNIDKSKPQRICNACYLEIRNKFEEDNFESAGSATSPRPAPPPSTPSRSSLTQGPASFFPLRSTPNILTRLLKGSPASPATPGAVTSSPSPVPVQKPSVNSSSNVASHSSPPVKASTESAYPRETSSSSASPAPSTETRKSIAAPRPSPSAEEASNEGLPRNWRVLKDERGRLYYWHVITDQVQYEKPTGRVKSTFAGGQTEGGSTTSATSGRSASSSAAPTRSGGSSGGSSGSPVPSNKPAPVKTLSPLNPSAPKQPSPKSGSIAPSTAVSGLRSPQKPSASATSDKKPMAGSQAPPSSPMVAPKPAASELKNEASGFRLSTGISTRGRMPMMGPSLAERLASLSEQGVFGDPAMARFSSKKSQHKTLKKVGSDRTITSSPLVNSTKETHRASTSNWQNSVSTPPSNNVASTYLRAASSGGTSPQPVQQRAAYSGGGTLVASRSTSFTLPKPGPSPASRTSTTSANAPINQSQGRLEVSRLSDAEFLRVMGVRRKDFDNYPAYMKVELKQAKNVV